MMTMCVLCRRANARQKAESSDKAAIKALSDADLARDEADKFLHQAPQTATSINYHPNLLL